MSSRSEELARRKQAVILQCAQEREDLAALCRRCRIPFDLKTTLMSAGNLLKGHPLLVAGVSGLLISGRGRGIARLGLELLGLWKTILPLWSWWARRRTRKQNTNFVTSRPRTGRY